MNKKKMALVHSVIALLLCCSMLIGTTFAWFTDSVTSGKNRIIAGNLDVELAYMDANGDWQTVNANTNVFEENTLWEPGHTEVVYLRVSNAGTLALTYQLGVNIAAETGSINVAGEEFVLSDYIEFAAIEGVETAFASREAARAAVQSAQILSTGYTQEGQLMAGDPADYVAFVVYMPETVGNEANYRTGEQAPKIELGINLYATQEVNERDSYDKNYDANAKAEFFDGFQGGYAVAAVTADDQSVTTEEVAVSGGDVSAVIPAGVQVAEGATSLPVSVAKKEASDANIQLGESDEMRPLDVHIEGVAAGNTVPMLITLKGYLSTGINTGALRLYHVENGATVAMTQVATPANHNEFSYDPATGDVTLALASFSEVAVVADNNNTWNGTVATAFADGSGTEADPYLIANADQLAYFRDEVDAGRMIDAHVKLANNITLSNVPFDPIGWGYVNTTWNRDGADGMVFQGTFDGNGKAIIDLYQNGWDLKNIDGKAYTYTNCGFGLFAAASNATFKNLTINGADVKVECVEAGVLVGLSQNNCTYDNIEIYNAKIANYQRPAGGLIGEVSGDGTTTITNVTIGSNVVVGSLWGDFDAPVGGVIGARWDDVDADPQIVMKNVEVGCRLDVYNDVTAAYQWHAYRRAGMLIGNTDTPAANGKTAQTATADFLTCQRDNEGNNTVIVHLGRWANYHYCRFTNQSVEWQNNYPWVRVEAGENNSAYSNVRYGHPVVNGVAVTDANHTCDGGAYHNMQISFAQLYGGGQGVYGATVHPGVTMEGYRYSIIYVNNDDVLSIQYVTDEMAEKTNPFIPNDAIAEAAALSSVKAQGYSNVVFDCWVTAGSKEAKIPASNTEDVTVYPSFTTPYTARFVDLDGNVLDWCFFNKDKSEITATEENAKKLLPPQDENIVRFSNWEVHYYNNNGEVVTEPYNSANFTGDHYTTDVTIYPVYTYAGKLNLEPVDSDGDGKTNYYKVVATAELDATTTIPGNVLGIPVKVVEKLYENDNSWDYGSGVKTVIIEEGVEELTRNSLGYTNDLTTVELPSTLTKLGKNTFSRNLWYNVFGDKDTKTLTIKYNGTKEDWDKVVANSDDEWANGLKKGTTVECTDGTYTVTSVNIENSNHKWSWTAK